jgi:hypothetical protein
MFEESLKQYRIYFSKNWFLFLAVFVLGTVCYRLAILVLYVFKKFSSYTKSNFQVVLSLLEDALFIVV